MHATSHFALMNTLNIFILSIIGILHYYGASLSGIPFQLLLRFFILNLLFFEEVELFEDGIETVLGLEAGHDDYDNMEHVKYCAYPVV